MSASNEWWTWHLTPRGWVSGSEKLDHYREPKQVEPPSDRVLSLVVHDYWPSTYRQEHWLTEEFGSSNDEQARQLLAWYGAKN
jgi:hypothetical protein